MSKDTKIVPNGIYEGTINGVTHYATCVAVLRHENGRVEGRFQFCGFADKVFVQGTADANAWRRRKWMPGARALDLKELIEDVVDVADDVMEVVTDVVKAGDKMVEEVSVLRKPGSSSKD